MYSQLVISSIGNVIVLENTCNTCHLLLIMQYLINCKIQAELNCFIFPMHKSGTKPCQIWVSYVLIPLGGACEHFLSET